MDLAQINQWLVGRLSSNPDIQYMTLNPQEGRQWPQRNRIECEGKSPDGVASEVCGEIDGMRESYRDEEKNLVRIKVILYKAKGTYVSERTFKIGHDVDTTNVRADGDGTKDGESVAMMREMRLALQDNNRALLASNEAIMKLSQGSLQLAMELTNRQAAITTDLAEAKAALVVSDNEQYSPMREIIDMCKPVLPVVLQAIAMKHIADNEKKKEIEDGK